MWTNWLAQKWIEFLTNTVGSFFAKEKTDSDNTKSEIISEKWDITVEWVEPVADSKLDQVGLKVDVNKDKSELEKTNTLEDGEFDEDDLSNLDDVFDELSFESRCSANTQIVLKEVYGVTIPNWDAFKSRWLERWFRTTLTNEDRDKINNYYEQNTQKDNLISLFLDQWWDDINEQNKKLLKLAENEIASGGVDCWEMILTWTKKKKSPTYWIGHRVAICIDKDGTASVIDKGIFPNEENGVLLKKYIEYCTQHSLWILGLAFYKANKNDVVTWN